MSGHDFTSSKAFGIESGHTPFRLRQSRYFELGLECAALASRHFSGSDADPNDRIEIWGRRIGRALSVVFAIYLAWSLLEMLGTRP